MEGDSAFDQRGEPVLRMNTFAREIGQSSKFNVRSIRMGGKELANQVSDLFSLGSAIGIDECPATLADRCGNECQPFSEAGRGTGKLKYSDRQDHVTQTD
jgi:hypothetical protein